MLDSLRRWMGLDQGRLHKGRDPNPKAAAPRHVAVIMDGNGRWAVRRGLPRTAGHRAGVETLKEIVQACPDLGIEILTAYAFSTENWKRDKSEVDFLMGLLVEYCRSEVDNLNKNGVRIQAIGRIDELPALQREEIQRAMELTRSNNRLILNLAVNYGAHAELVDAMRAIAQKVQEGRLAPEEIDEQVVERHLYTAGLPDPDLLIRTGGEMRLSNFLLWQASYTEIWVSDVPWPDFSRRHLQQAIQDYQRRERRFGAVLQQSR